LNKLFQIKSEVQEELLGMENLFREIAFVAIFIPMGVRPIFINTQRFFRQCSYQTLRVVPRGC